MTQHPAPIPQLFGEDFAARPQDAYAALRAHGPVAWAEIAPAVYALVVTSHRAAVTLLNDTATYSKDSRSWAALHSGQVPPDSPVLAIMAYRPNLLYADGREHERLRGAIEDCAARIDLHELRESTQRHSLGLISRFAPAGRADLMTEFADTIPLLVFTDILGCPAPMVGRMVAGSQGLISAGPEAMQAAADFARCLAELIEMKKTAPGRDFTSWMLAHPAGLASEEILQQLFCFVGAGVIPTAAWIASGLRLLLEDDAYAGDLTGGAVTVRRAMEQVLWTRSPMANFAVHFARRATMLHGVPIPPGVPILISHAATGTDPQLPPGLGHDNRSHLAWSAGPHRCPADSHAAVIAQTAIETLLDRLWDLELTDVGVPNRHGPFHQCPAALGVRFRPQPADALTASPPGGST
ncbi:cytochrome P450 [Planomonospora sp. ID91781]|uniref:cytochrome P450 n=1 Tax=Planomonospora sp. ID91781 TaxID=2738135 RepID=UPI0018C3EEA2|nr:cytochrome P450 [Planomonospora sp. ID91781]MBG0822230.1 cytochrome P450 [Planomonospora sp. ID91781]